MRKIPTLFERDWDNNPKHVTRKRHPDCAWVFAGEGLATRKYDGTCLMHDADGDFWARREVKPGKADPAEFQLIEEDAETGKRVGWVPIEQSGFGKLMPEALNWSAKPLTAGTYELCGPKINRNPEQFDHHVLIEHATAQDFDDVPRDYEGLAGWLRAHPYEGLVFQHPDGRMGKIKRRDFPV